MSLVGIKFKLKNWSEIIKKREDEIRLFIAAQIQENRGQLFDSQGSFNNRPGWAPLKFRAGQIMSQRGTLRKSIAPTNPDGRPGDQGIVRFEGPMIYVGTKLLKARLLNFGTVKMPGGVLRPVRAKALKIPIPQGKWAGEGARNIQRAAVSRQILAKQKQLENARTEQSRVKIQGQINRLMTKFQKGEGPVKFIFRKSVRIPPRPFDDWNKTDQRELDLAIAAKLREVLSNG